MVPGIRICDQLPQIAKVTDKLAIIRSFSHPRLHEVGVNYTLTGRFKDGLVVPRNMRNRNEFPMVGIGGVVFQSAGAAGGGDDSAADRSRWRDSHRHVQRLSRSA